jgi:endo-1,4-beta-xylanase
MFRHKSQYLNALTPPAAAPPGGCMNSRLPQHRLGTATLAVSAPDGSPLAHREIRLEQTAHKFLFGTAAFDIVPLSNGEYGGLEKERAEERARKLTDLFNAATLPFYWARYEPQRGRPLTTQLTNAARWCSAHGLVVKGHPLCWHTLTADWLLSMNAEQILREQLSRVRREVANFAGLVNMWDVINEAVIMPVFDKYRNGITDLCQETGRLRLIKALFEAARAENPAAILLINDFDVSPAYDILVEGCLDAGIRIDAIGIQSHMHQGYWGVEKTLAVLDHFARFQLPIHFTETTLVSGQLMPPEIVDLNDYQVQDWPTTPEGEARQAEEAVKHYKTLFGHPLVESITWWDLADGGWLNAPGGLIRKDGSSKPAYAELLKVVKGDWWVAPSRDTTDEDGRIAFAGALGDYELTFDRFRQSFSLTSQEETVIEVRL